MDAGADPNSTRDLAGGMTRNFMEAQNEASVCAQLVSAVTLLCPNRLIKSVGTL